MTKTTFKKYDIGSPKRTFHNTSSRKKYSSLKKYNLGPPRRPSSEMESVRPYREESEEMKKVTPRMPRTPRTPRTAAWEKWEKKGELGYISDYEEDEDDKLAKKKRAKLGILSPKTYTTFEDIQTPFMTEAHKKKPLTDAIEQVDEEAWKKKRDDSPNRNPGKSLIGGMGRIGGRRRRSRGRSRGRSRR